MVVRKGYIICDLNLKSVCSCDLNLKLIMFNWESNLNRNDVNDVLHDIPNRAEDGSNRIIASTSNNIWLQKGSNIDLVTTHELE